MVKEKDMPVIVFDDSVRDKLLNSLGMSQDKDSNLIDDSGKTITSQDFESINSEEFGGILVGSKVSIKKEESELVKYFISEI